MLKEEKMKELQKQNDGLQQRNTELVFTNRELESRVIQLGKEYDGLLLTNIKLGETTDYLNERILGLIATLKYMNKYKRQCSCAECEFNETCEYAWDAYNTNGDCLAEK